MPIYRVYGVRKSDGKDVVEDIPAADAAQAEQLSSVSGVMVESVMEIKKQDAKAMKAEKKAAAVAVARKEVDLELAARLLRRCHRLMKPTLPGFVLAMVFFGLPACTDLIIAASAANEITAPIIIYALIRLAVLAILLYIIFCLLAGLCGILMYYENRCLEESR